MNRLRVTLVLVLLAATVSTSGRQQENSGGYIEQRFHTAINESPKLAWILPGGTIVADSRSSQIIVYSSAVTVEKAQLRATVTAAKASELAKKNHVACDEVYKKPASFSLYDSSIKHFNGNPQALYTSEPLPGMKAGYQVAALDGALGEEVWQIMQPKSPQQPRKATIVRRDGVPYFYSLAALYDGPEREICRMGMFLQASDGHVIASNVGDVDEWCDGCAIPTFNDGIERAYSVKHLFTSPQFSYPLLVLDTSSVEGRSITLSTFSPEGKYSDYFLYEYTVGCN